MRYHFFMHNKQQKFAKNYFEKQAWTQQYFVCGIDEAGRGCLAGPVVVGAAILPHNTSYKLLKDSKVMAEHERETAYAWIKKHCFFTSVVIDHHTIDRCNIYQATRFGMKKAFLQLCELIPFAAEKITYLLTDAVPLTIPPYDTHKNLTLFNPTKGESVSASIAAASIIAKVTRDRLMAKISYSFPAFSFEEHKGYGTPTHTQALTANGQSIIHRQTFLTNFSPNTEHHEQQTIC